MTHVSGREYTIKEVDNMLALVESRTGRVVFWLSEMISTINLDPNDVATVETKFAIKVRPNTE